MITRLLYLLLLPGLFLMPGLSAAHEGNLPSNRIFINGNADNEEALFEQGMELYRQAQYDSAAVFFEQLETAEGRLFTGKSHWAAGNYQLARHHLYTISRNDDPRFYDEARYTLALTYFQSHQFGKSLDILQNMLSRPLRQDLRSDVRTLYNQILSYLTIEQRKQAFLQSELSAVHIDLLRYGLDYMTRSEASALLEALRPYFETVADVSIITSLERRIARLPDQPSDVRSIGSAPDGMVYTIGVILPEASRGSTTWQVSRSLYHGYLIAAEQYNRDHPSSKIRLKMLETSDTLLTEEAAVSRFAWDKKVDAILGPFFSESAHRVAELAEYYQIPVITPLANADTLNISNPYLFQMNPTFETRGKQMARFAVQELRLDTLAVITQSNQPVSAEARAFRVEAERLGATVLHYFSENFERRAFEVGHITPWFAGRERFVDIEEYPIKPVKGLYLAFTGSGAEHLIELILTDLQAIRSNVTILSNQTIAHANVSTAARRYFDIYYSDFFHLKRDSRHSLLLRDEYRTLTGQSPDDYAYLGYDVARFLFKTLNEVRNPARLKNKMRVQPYFEGTISRIDFNGTHVNQHLNFMHMGRDETILYQRRD
ncbi:ABC transporter substrate-binding protein [Balneolaceae bacterium ANBcel3]|nr:ABC transporter substrate-binding protein [Balneolaceae bacterium ANBcel3]